MEPRECRPSAVGDLGSQPFFPGAAHGDPPARAQPARIPRGPDVPWPRLPGLGERELAPWCATRCDKRGSRARTSAADWRQTTPSTPRGQGALETASLPVDSPPRKRRSSMKLYNTNLSNFASKCRLAIYEKNAKVDIVP